MVAVMVIVVVMMRCASGEGSKNTTDFLERDVLALEQLEHGGV